MVQEREGEQHPATLLLTIEDKEEFFIPSVEEYEEILRESLSQKLQKSNNRCDTPIRKNSVLFLFFLPPLFFELRSPPTINKYNVSLVQPEVDPPIRVE